MFEVEKTKESNFRKQYFQVDFMFSIDFKNFISLKKKKIYYFERGSHSAYFEIKFIILG